VLPSFAPSVDRLAFSPVKINKKYDMVTLNDAVPIAFALLEAVKASDTDGECVKVKTNGRMNTFGEAAKVSNTTTPPG